MLDEEVIIINMWDSWSLYAAFVLIGVMIFGIFWGKRRDAQDEENMQLIRKKQQKIYVNLFLEPIEQPRKQPVDGEDFMQVN